VFPEVERITGRDRPQSQASVLQDYNSGAMEIDVCSRTRALQAADCRRHARHDGALAISGADKGLYRA